MLESSVTDLRWAERNVVERTRMLQDGQRPQWSGAKASLLGPRPGCVQSMPAGGAETERLQELL